MTLSTSPSASSVPRIRAVVVSIVGLGVLAGLIWFANPSRVLQALRGAEPVWIALSVAGVLISTLLGAINSYLMAAPGPALGFKRFLQAYWVAWAFGQVVPGQIGDLLGMSLFLKRRGLSMPAAVGRLGVDKLVSLLCTFTLAGGLVLLFIQPVVRLAGTLGLAAAAGLLVAYLTSRKWAGSVRSGSGLRLHLANTIAEAHRVIATRPGAVTANALLTMLKLLVIGVCYWSVFGALHADAGNVLKVTVTANSAGLIAYVPISANGVGTVEAGGVYLFGLRGITAPVVIAAYLVLRFTNLALAWIGSAFILLGGLWSRRLPAP